MLPVLKVLLQPNLHVSGFKVALVAFLRHDLPPSVEVMHDVPRVDLVEHD